TAAGAKGAAAPAVAGQTLPRVVLPTTAGGTASDLSLLGKPTVGTVLSTWAPATTESLPAFDRLHSNGDMNVVALVLGERLRRVQSLLGRSGYELPVVVDADVVLGGVLGVPNAPTHYIMDRRGVIRRVLTGVVSAEQLVSALSEL